MSITSIRTLRLLMPLSALSSSLTQLGAIVTNQWLFTMELMPNAAYERFKMPPEMEHLRKYTQSGMLQLCQNSPPKSEMTCSYIDYLSKEDYVPDQNDSTMAIPYSMRRAAGYIVASVLILLLGELLYACRKVCCGRRRQICTFISGIAFILAGLTILAGLVVYISTFKGEVSNKLRPLSEFQDALFHYRYGGSFLLLVASLLLCEVTGTLAVLLYIAQRQFKVDLDSEREEVLKRSLLGLMMGPAGPDLRRMTAISTGDEEGVSNNKRTSHDSSHSLRATSGPMLRIVCEDEDGLPLSPGNGPTSPAAAVDRNFLSAEFGLSDPAMYFYGRHGSRGRRNSRSNESFLGPTSPSGSVDQNRSRKGSFTSMLDEVLAIPPLPVPSLQQHQSKLQNKNLKASKQQSVDLPVITVRQHSPPVDRRYSPDSGLPGLLELHVPSLSTQFRQPIFKIDEPSTEGGGKQKKKTTISKQTRPHLREFDYHHRQLLRSESEELVEQNISYFLPISNIDLQCSNQSNPNDGNNSRHRLTKQRSLNHPNNRSTYV